MGAIGHFHNKHEFGNSNLLTSKISKKFLVWKIREWNWARQSELVVPTEPAFANNKF